MAYDKFLTVAGNEIFDEDNEKVAIFNKDRIEYDSSKIGGGGGSASDVSFDNSLTELVAENVQNAIEELADESHNIIDSLTANDTRVYIDYHDGKYGINTSEERGEGTFIPFHNGGGGIAIGEGVVLLGFSTNTFDIEKYYFIDGTPNNTDIRNINDDLEFVLFSSNYRIGLAKPKNASIRNNTTDAVMTYSIT